MLHFVFSSDSSLQPMFEISLSLFICIELLSLSPPPLPRCLSPFHFIKLQGSVCPSLPLPHYLSVFFILFLFFLLNFALSHSPSPPPPPQRVFLSPFICIKLLSLSLPFPPSLSFSLPPSLPLFLSLCNHKPTPTQHTCTPHVRTLRLYILFVSKHSIPPSKLLPIKRKTRMYT